MRSKRARMVETPDAVARFSGSIEYRWLRGPFFAELVVTDNELTLAPRFIRTFRRAATAKADVQRITVGGVRSGGVRFETANGTLERYTFVPFSPGGRRRLRDELRRRGYPLAD